MISQPSRWNKLLVDWKKLIYTDINLFNLSLVSVLPESLLHLGQQLFWSPVFYRKLLSAFQSNSSGNLSCLMTVFADNPSDEDTREGLCDTEMLSTGGTEETDEVWAFCIHAYVHRMFLRLPFKAPPSTTFIVMVKQTITTVKPFF